MALATAMEDLDEDTAALSMDRIGYGFPAGDVFREIDAGRTIVRTAGDRDGGRFGDQEAALGGALPVEVRHHRERRIDPV
jgi:hypothetical protein